MLSTTMPTRDISRPLSGDDDDARWRAVERRDRAADGTFVYSVQTTGVYCRPSCAARLPRRENVSFHATCADAERAGFRPCKRCRPNAPGLAEQHAAAVAKACRLIEEAEEMPGLAVLARAAGLSRFHFHRVFKAVTGVTPKAYADAHRGKRVREELASSGTVTEAIYGAGFNSSGRFYDASPGLLGMTPTRIPQPAAAATSSALRSANARSARSWWRRRTRGSVPSSSATIPMRWCGALRIAFRRRGSSAATRRSSARGQGRRLGRGAGPRPRFAARHPRHRVPAAGVECDPRDPGGIDRELSRDRQAHRRAEGGARGGAGLCVERARGGHSLPPRGANRRIGLRLSLGRCAQARPAGAGAGGMRPAQNALRERAPASSARVLAAHIGELDWTRIAADLDAHGCATTGPLLTSEQCAALAGSYPSDTLFRSRVVMTRHGFGRGEYKYFAYPLPDLVAGLRGALYPPLAEIANRWNEAMGVAPRYPQRSRDLSLPLPQGRARRSRRRCCCNTVPATTIACIRISTASMSSRCRSRSCCRGRARISPAANSCSRSSGRACSRGRRLCRSSRARA